MSNEIQLGDIAEDVITGFRGVVVAITKWLHGCRRITIQPQKMKDGKPLENHTFDEPQVKVIKSKVHSTTDRTGGPQQAPIQKALPPQR